MSAMAALALRPASEGLAYRIVLAAALGCAGVGLSQTPAGVRFVDDLGREIHAELQLCPKPKPAGGGGCLTIVDGLALEERFTGSSEWAVEGPFHGPALFRLGDETSQGRTVAVPRKASVDRRDAAARWTLSLYPVKDEKFERARFVLDATAEGPIWIPAGAYVASLRREGRAAPALSLIALEAGEARKLDTPPAVSWALLVRILDANREAVGNAALELLSIAPDREDSVNVLARGRSAESGLAVFSGRSTPPLAEIRVAHPSFLPSSARGVVMPSTGFGFRDVLLHRGGAIAADVLLDGKPLAGALCQVVEYVPSPEFPAPAEIVLSARTGPDGRCSSRRVPTGNVTFRVRRTEARGFTEIPLQIEAGEESTLAVVLEHIEIRGSVVLGGEPVEGARVAFFFKPVDARGPLTGEPSLELVSNEEGAFNGDLWTSGDYDVLSWAPGLTFPSIRTIYLANSDEEVLVDLSAKVLYGSVVDDVSE